MEVCNCSLFCCTLPYVNSSIAFILMGKRELIALLNLSSWCLVMVERPFLAVPWGCLRFVIVVFPDHTHLQFFKACNYFSYLSVFCFLFNVFLYIHEYANEIICLFIFGATSYISTFIWYHVWQSRI